MPREYSFPKHIRPESTYTGSQVLELLRAYGEAVSTASWAAGFGSELDAPDVVDGALEKLLKAKEIMDTLPPEIRKINPEIIRRLEEDIKYCKKGKEALKGMREMCRKLEGET